MTTSEFRHKIVDLETLLAKVRDARLEGRTVVQCHGCFDIVHPGHIRYLQFARQQGDVLIVSITGDSDVDKGDQRPYIPQELRAENLAALMFVDLVTINPSPTAAELLDRVRPDVYVKGREYERSTDTGFLSEKAVVESYGGRIIFSSGEIVFSSTELIERMPETRERERRRPWRFCRRHDISQGSLATTLERIGDLRVLIVGDVLIDRYVGCDALGVASESPMMSLTQIDERSYVGGAGIVARHVAAMGGKAFLLSAGANDDQTSSVKDVLLAEGVESDLMNVRPALVEKTRFMVDNTKLFKVDRGQRQPLDSVAERRAAQILEHNAHNADAVIFCDFGYGMITASLLSRVLPGLRQNVRILTADVSGARASLLDFRFFDLLCPTEREARATLNDHDSGLSAVAWDILDQTQARHLFVTLEKQGLIVFERREQDRSSPDWSARLKSEPIPALSDYPIDLLGCGDALLAGATLALAAGAPLMKAAYLGSAMAAITASTLGNEPVQIDRLRQWLADRSELVAEETQTTSESVTTAERNIADVERQPQTRSESSAFTSAEEELL